VRLSNERIILILALLISLKSAIYSDFSSIPF